jgi:hypothetical protein
LFTDAHKKRGHSLSVRGIAKRPVTPQGKCPRYDTWAFAIAFELLRILAIFLPQNNSKRYTFSICWFKDTEKSNFSDTFSDLFDYLIIR